MASHQTAYKCTERIDPKIKRRLRRSQEWQNKRDEMVNRRRKIGVMSPCTEFDLSLNSPVLENALTKTSEDKENKKITRENKKQQKCSERLKMLQKWKEEKELQRKQMALEKAKCKPFVVTVMRQPSKSAFDIKWEQKLQKKQTKTTVPVAEPPRKTRAASATTRSTTAATRATTRATTHQADVAHKQKASSLVLPEKKAPTTRQPARHTAASESKRVPLTTQTRVTRQTNNSKAATRATTRTLPSTKPKTTSSVTQKQAKSKVEPPVKGKNKPATTHNFDILSSKVTTRSERQEGVSFVPGNFVFTAPENLQPYDFSSSLSPNSTQNFFFSGFDEPPTNIFGRISDSPTKNGDVEEEEMSPNRSGMVEESEVPEEQDPKCPEIIISSEPPLTPVRNSADIAVFKTPVSSISLRSKKNQQSSSDSKPSNKKKPRKSSSCPKMGSAKVPQSPEEWVELLKNSPMIEMTRRKVPKHQLDQIPTFSLEGDDVMRTALKEASTTSVGQRAVETGDVTSETQEIEGSVILEAAAADTQQTAKVVTQVAPAESVTQVAPGETTVIQVSPTESDTQETPAETATQETPAETITQVAPVEMTVTQRVPTEADTQETPAETATQETPAETITQVAPVETTVTQGVPAVGVSQDAAETVIQETPASVPQEAVETITLETPVMEAQEMETVLQGEVTDVPKEVAEIATHDASGMTNQEASVTTPEKTVEAVNQESTGQALQELSSDESSQPNSESEKSDTENVEHNVPYFRNLVVSQTEILKNLSDFWETIVPTLSEEVEGDVRTVIGQAKLLISQRFHQFIGLVDNCEFNTGEKTTTCEDLQGFWDMVDFQVSDVKKKFADLQKLKDNNWQTEDIPLTKLVKKIKKAKPVTSKVSKVKGKSKFAQFLAQKKKVAENENSTGGNADEAEKEESVKVFDGHFFKVESPVRSPKPHCLGSPRSPVVMPVFIETTQERSANIQTDILEKDNSDDKTFQTIEIEPKGTETVQPVSSENSFDSAKVTPLVSRRSYVPTVPSPLLQDITPVRKRASTNRRSRLLGEAVNTPDISQPVLSSASVENVESENEVFVLQSPPRRRSQRISRRLSAMESFSKTPSKDSTNTEDCVPVGQLVDLSEHASTNNCESTIEKETPITKRRSRAKLTPEVQSGSRRSTRIARLSVFHVEPCSTNVENHADMNLIDFQTPMTSKRKSVKRPKSVAFADSVTEEEENCSTPAGDLTTVLCPISPNVDCTETIEQNSKKLPRFGKLKVGYTPIRSRQNRRSSQQMEEEN